jgi:hypothetical protein
MRSARILARRGRHATQCAGLELNPSFGIGTYRPAASTFSDNPVYLVGCECIIEGMRKAGVPEE